MVGLNSELGGDRAKQRLSGLLACASLLPLRGDALGVLPDRLQVAPPVERKRPARQGLARIPFALPVMQEAAGREAVAQAPDQPVGERPLGRTDRVRVPLARFEVVDRNEGRLAAHGQPNVVSDQLLVDLLAERVERCPGSFRKRLGDARMFRHPLDLHVEIEIDIGETRHARNRRGVAIMWRRGQWNVAFRRQQSRSRIEADPARAGQIDLGPGVEIGEVVVRARRPVERDEIGLQLNEIAGHEPGGQARDSGKSAPEASSNRGTNPNRARMSLPASAPPIPCG